MQSHKSEAIRKTAKFLRSQPEVIGVKSDKNRYLHINFADKFVEHWSYYDIDEKSKFYGRFLKIPDNDFYPFDDKWPEFRCQFSRTSSDEFYDQKGKFFLYTSNYLSGFKFGNIRIFLHRLASALAAEGYVQPWLPDNEIKSTIDSFNRLKLGIIRRSEKIYKERFEFISRLRPILTTFVADNGFWTVNNIFTTMDKLCKRHIKITRSNIVWYMRKMKKIKFKTGYPVGMSAFLRDKYNGMSIIDHTNSTWLKVVALINNVEYKTQGDDGVHITNNRQGHNKEVIIGEGDYRIIGANPNNMDFIHLTSI